MVTPVPCNSQVIYTYLSSYQKNIGFYVEEEEKNKAYLLRMSTRNPSYFEGIDGFCPECQTLLLVVLPELLHAFLLGSVPAQRLNCTPVALLAANPGVEEEETCSMYSTTYVVRTWWN